MTIDSMTSPQPRVALTGDSKGYGGYNVPMTRRAKVHEAVTSVSWRVEGGMKSFGEMLG
jgi:hypothetical protein